MMPLYLIFDLEMTLIFNVNKVLSNTHVQYQVSIMKGGGVMHFFLCPSDGTLNGSPCQNFILRIYLEILFSLLFYTALRGHTSNAL